MPLITTPAIILATVPLRPGDAERCRAGGRFGAHNIHPNFPGPGSVRLRNTAVASWFNGGVRIERFHTETNSATFTAATATTPETLVQNPPLSLTDAVIVCTPIDSVRVNEGPLPMTPSRLDVHCTADERSPSCASLAEPVNVMALLTRNDAPDAGDEIDTTGSVLAAPS